MKKILWFDCETGGVDHKKNALLQLSAIIEIDNKIVDKIYLKMKPVIGKSVEDKAIAVHGMTTGDIMEFEDPEISYEKFYKFLQREPKSKSNRFIMAGYNSDFDCRFLSEWFENISGGPYAYWDYLQFSPIDVLPTLRAMRYAGILDIKDTRLETVCKHFEIELNAHDSMSDITATRKLTKIVYGKLFGGWFLVDKAINARDKKPIECQVCDCDALVDYANDIINGSSEEGSFFE